MIRVGKTVDRKDGGSKPTAARLIWMILDMQQDCREYIMIEGKWAALHADLFPVNERLFTGAFVPVGAAPSARQ